MFNGTLKIRYISLEPVKKRRLSSVCLVGGADHRYQKQLLEEGVDVVVGTPGRVGKFSILKGI
mgnify:CR=1 FL=1